MLFHVPVLKKILLAFSLLVKIPWKLFKRNISQWLFYDNHKILKQNQETGVFGLWYLSERAENLYVSAIWSENQFVMDNLLDDVVQEDTYKIHNDIVGRQWSSG